MEPTNKNLIQLLESVVEATQKKGLLEESFNSNEDVAMLVERLQLSSMQVVLLAAFVDNFEDKHITIADLAKYFDCKNIRILTHWSDIETLTKKRYIQGTSYDEEIDFRVQSEVMKSLRDNKAFVPKTYEGLNAQEWCEEMSDLIRKKKKCEIASDVFREDIVQLIKANQSLTIARELEKLRKELDWEDMLAFLGMMDLYIRNNDNHIIRSDLEDLYDKGRTISRIANNLENDVHILQLKRLVEFSNSCGQIESDAWCLTDDAKNMFLSEITLKPKKKQHKLKLPNDITPKQLYYNEAVTNQVQTLTNLLQQERFTQIQNRLEQKGMRRGVACIFYGSPGTGKTETVLQLARQTGRSVMQVDIPNLRSKWVGDTEKNIKAVFDVYRSCCKEEAVAPILLFNEADAVLCKRNEGAVHSVDKMENAMQNIILQEMETLDGIMIATTNLTGNLDAAFERRFLYKIEFPKPTANESLHIWKTMLPDLSDDDAYTLAQSYQFSGGQIENIARKQIVDSILSDEEGLAIEHIREACEAESFKHSSNKRIGFC